MLLDGDDQNIISENVRTLRNKGYGEHEAIQTALQKARMAGGNGEGNRRSAADIANDLNTLRKGQMPTGAKAGGAGAGGRVADHTPDPDPVEERRYQMAMKRNKGLNKDVNLPVEKK
jgi:hypothetical protein